MEMRKKALVSVSNKEGLIDLVKILIEYNYEIISTGGTRKVLHDAGIDSTDITTVTGNPEAFGGRMKTLSFNIGSALLFDREKDVEEASKLGIQPIDMVICNFYPFEAVAQKTFCLPELVENIDIGGPCMVRAAAKNGAWVSVITKPHMYPEIIQELQQNKGNLSFSTRLNLMQVAFSICAEYDFLIANTLSSVAGSLSSISQAEFPPFFNFSYKHQKTLRYGENPHQQASIYLKCGTELPYTVLGGKELSYNNVCDMYSACDLSFELLLPACVIVKHANPCGVAIEVCCDILVNKSNFVYSENKAYSLLEIAWSGDPVSSFGSVIVFNRPVTKEHLVFLNLDAENKNQRKYVELIGAPAFSDEAIDYLKQHSQLRVVILAKMKNPYKYKIIENMALVQENDTTLMCTPICVTEAPFIYLNSDLLNFGLTTVKFLKSNAIALVEKTPNGFYRLLGAGVGQPNRLESTRLALSKARENLASEGQTEQQIRQRLSEVLLISDAFFPFPDSVEEVAKAGIRFIVQPGGSIRDKQVVDCCNKYGVSMIFIIVRHFNH